MKNLIESTPNNHYLSFDDYLLLTDDIISEKITRSGKYLNDKTFRYTRSNAERMKWVLDNTVLQQKLYNLLSALKKQWIWVVITEPWCGDASWGVPALYLIASSTDAIDFKIMLRDTYPDWIKRYQTNGTDSIPKLICFDRATGEELGCWGPRPQKLIKDMMSWVTEGENDYTQIVRKLHRWYEEDKSNSIQDELIDAVKLWMK